MITEHDKDIDGAMEEVIPRDSPARSLYEMTPERQAHRDQIVERHAEAMREKYTAGQACHGGDLAHKPGMLAHALQENMDESFYMRSLEWQIEDLACRLEAGGFTQAEAAAALRRMLTP